MNDELFPTPIPLTPEQERNLAHALEVDSEFAEESAREEMANNIRC